MATNPSSLSAFGGPGSLVRGYTGEIIKYASFPQLAGEYLAVRKVDWEGVDYLEAIFISAKDAATGKVWSTSGLPNKKHAPVYMNPMTAQKKLSNKSWLVIRHENLDLLRYVKDNIWGAANVDTIFRKLEATRGVVGDAGTLELTLQSLPREELVPNKPFDPFEL